MKDKIVKVEGLKKHFPVGKQRTLKAVDDVSFSIYRGETFGLVGESGCGKTTCGRTLLNLYQLSDGTVKFNDQEVSHLKGKDKLAFKKQAQMIFQDPYASLNPRMTVFETIAEGLKVHFNLSKQSIQEKVDDMLLAVGLTPSFGNRFPHELSGGQCQRVGIARALIVEPDLIVCDEPISALDVSIQAQIVNLLKGLQKEKALTYLFISHDLAMVKHISHRIGVMYLGNIVELCDSETLYEKTLHPYSQVLLSAIPDAEIDEGKRRKRIEVIGEIPSPINPPPGCKFSDRCPMAGDQCHIDAPSLKEIEKNHWVACHFADEILEEWRLS